MIMATGPCHYGEDRKRAKRELGLQLNDPAHGQMWKVDLERKRLIPAAALGSFEKPHPIGRL